MPIRNPSKKAFSYTNHTAVGRNFLNKNFSKTKSYHSNFSESVFCNTSFLSPTFKFCSFFGVRFTNCFFRSARFMHCNLRNCFFEKCIIEVSIFDQCKASGSRFDNCIIVGTPSLLNNFSIDRNKNDYYISFNEIKEFSDEIIIGIEALRGNQIIRQSKVLHRKRGMIDTATLIYLEKELGEENLLHHIQKLPHLIKTQFSTPSYILHAIKRDGK